MIDFSPQPRGTSSRGFAMPNSYWHVKGLVIHSAGDNGIYVTGSNNTVEDCVLFDNEDTGLQISGGGSYNLVLNCDSYANYDSATHGENADGFAPKLNIGPGNVFRGCRAWWNSDDGWDLWMGTSPVTIRAASSTPATTPFRAAAICRARRMATTSPAPIPTAKTSSAD